MIKRCMSSPEDLEEHPARLLYRIILSYMVSQQSPGCGMKIDASGNTFCSSSWDLPSQCVC